MYEWGVIHIVNPYVLVQKKLTQKSIKNESVK